MASLDDFVLVDHPRPNIALVTPNRHERMNAMAFDLMVPLAEALRGVNNDNDVRAVVITGAGHGFCSGADMVCSGSPPCIRGLTRSTIAHRAADRLHEVIELIGDLHQPVIAAINGAAIGFEIMLTGRDVHAEEAARIGLVSEAVAPEDVLERCYEIGARIAAFSRPGTELTKRMLWAGLEASSHAAHMRSEMNAQLLVRMTTRNFEEAVLARQKKAPPGLRRLTHRPHH